MPQGTIIQPIAGLSKLPEGTMLFEIKGDLMNGLNAFIEKYQFKPKVILQFRTVHYIDTKIPTGER